MHRAHSYLLYTSGLVFALSLGSPDGAAAAAIGNPKSQTSEGVGAAPGEQEQKRDISARQSTESVVKPLDILKTLAEAGEVASDGKTTKDILADFFRRTGCSVPKKMKRKLDKLEDGAWVPSDARYEFDDIWTRMAFKLQEGASIRAALHSVKIDKSWKTLTGAASYSQLNPFEYLDSEYTNFSYSMDCSGFLNAAVAAGAGVRAAKLESSAEMALRTQRSFLLLRATLFSPISAALRPRSSPEGLSASDVDRMDTLWALLAETGGQPDTTKIYVMHRIQVIGTSRQGSSSMQGRAALTGGASASAGFGSVSLSASSGLTQGREVSYQTFATYLLGEPVAIEVVLSEVQDVMRALVSRASTTVAASDVNGDLVVSKALPSRLCREEWKAEAGNHTVISTYANDSCKFVVHPKPAQPAGIVVRMVNALGEEKHLELTLSMEMSAVGDANRTN